MRADHAQQSDRCNVSKDDVFQTWLQERKIEDVEAFVPDMAGSARGKVIPADKFGSGQIKMPEGIFSQTITGDYIDDVNNVEDRDMLLVPDPTTLRPVPWLSQHCVRSPGCLILPPRCFLTATIVTDRRLQNLRVPCCEMCWRNLRHAAGHLSLRLRLNFTC